MIKLLHTADWHLGRRLEGRSRHEEQCQVLDEICQIADDEQVDAVLVAGDVFDGFVPPAESEALFYRTMVRLADGGKRAVVVIAGNHDSPDRLIASDPYARALGISTLGYPKDIPHLYELGADRVACVESAPSFVRLRLPSTGKVLTVLGLPYPSETRLREVLTADIGDQEQAAFDYNSRISDFMKGIATGFQPGEANIVASHLYVAQGLMCDSERQIQVGGAYTVDPRSFPAEAGYVALGHLHRPQEQPGERDIPVRYSGSILQYSFSEAGQRKEVTIVEFDQGTTTHRSIQLGAGRQLERIEVESLDELEQRLAAADPTSWLAISILLDKAMPLDYMAAVRELHPGIITCTPRYRFTEAELENVARISQLNPDEQFRRFVETRYNEHCNEQVLQLFLELIQDPGTRASRPVQTETSGPD